jgi:hypothetical protein
MNDSARSEHRRQELMAELRYSVETRYRVSQFADSGYFDITESHNQHLQEEIAECDRMIAHEQRPAVSRSERL